MQELRRSSTEVKFCFEFLLFMNTLKEGEGKPCMWKLHKVQYQYQMAIVLSKSSWRFSSQIKLFHYTMSLQVLIIWRKTNLHQNPDCLFAKALAFVSFRKHWNYLGLMCAKVTPTSHCDRAAMPWNFQLCYFSELFFKTAVQNVCIGKVLGFSFFFLYFFTSRLSCSLEFLCFCNKGVWESNYLALQFFCS